MGAVDFITKIKRFLGLAQDEKAESRLGSVAGVGVGVRSLAASPVAAPGGPAPALPRGGRLLRLARLLFFPGGRGPPGLGVQADLAASPVGGGCENPSDCPCHSEQSRAESESGGPGLERHARSALLSVTRLLSLSNRPQGHGFYGTFLPRCTERRPGYTSN